MRANSHEFALIFVSRGTIADTELAGVKKA
jgi:hypothetical protein